MNMTMKTQPGISANETSGPAPYNTSAHLARADPVPRLVRYAQNLLAVIVAALCIAALVGFENFLSENGLIGGGAYVGALVIPILVVRCCSTICEIIARFTSDYFRQAVYTVIILCIKPSPARLIAEYVAIPLWILAAAYLAGESAIVMDSNCLDCVYIYGSGPNAGAAAAGLGGLEM